MKNAFKNSEVRLSKIQPPTIFSAVKQVSIDDETIALRKEKIIGNMRAANVDYLLIYADKEHGANFEYLTGFIPRFEEALLILPISGQAFLLLGNENMKMAQHARIDATAVHVPYFSLPNQPMSNSKTLQELLMESGIQRARKAGIVGWKLFTSSLDDNAALFDVPYYIIDALQKIISPDAALVNATHFYIGGQRGARVINNANEIAHYEYGANLASHCMLSALDAIAPGKTETEIGRHLAAEGQPNTVVSIAAAGERFVKANLYPSDRQIGIGDKMSLTTGFKGGLSSRAGYVVERAEQLEESERDYLEKVVFPYYRAIVAWLENIRIGMPGKELYALIEAVLPKERYHWSLNPGHLVSDEEWQCSPIYPDSDELISSGMLFQIDIIPSVTGYAGVSAEEGVALADAQLRHEIASRYPQVWQRMQQRRDYIRQMLKINISDEILPMSSTVGYLRPFLLDKNRALQCC